MSLVLRSWEKPSPRSPHELLRTGSGQTKTNSDGKEYRLRHSDSGQKSEAKSEAGRESVIKGSLKGTARPMGREPQYDFKKPPAVETLLGAHFAPLANWRTPNFGLFWNDIKKEYPTVEVLPPLPGDPPFKVELEQEQAKLRVSGEIPVRWWYFHKTDRRLIQIQSNSFIQNWRKRSENDPYIHYGELRPAFKEIWTKYLSFLRKNNVAQPKVQRCEVAYVNHIDKGVGWNRFADLSHVISAWSPQQPSRFLPHVNTVALTAVYPMAKQNGTLTISLQPGVRQSDGKTTLQLVVAAKCRPLSSGTADLLSSFDLCREWVVEGFTDFTTEDMHQIWQKVVRSRNRRET